MQMCHMVADTTEELLSMAVKIGLAQRWLQKPGTPREHFDVCLSMRTKAVQLGAIEVGSQVIVELMERKRVAVMMAQGRRLVSAAEKGES
jgi:hypothetical protein